MTGKGRLLGVIAALIAPLAGVPSTFARADHRNVIVGPSGALPANGGLPTAAQGPPSPKFAPGRIVVRYSEAVDACVPCIVTARASFATVTGSDSLDRLHERLGLRAARALFSQGRDLGARAARAAFQSRLTAARRRFPLRAARAPAGAADPDLTRVHVLDISDDVDPAEAARAYAADPAVAWAIPDVEVDVGLTPNDPYLSTSGSWGRSYADLWGLDAIDARTAWDTTTGQGTVIAVVDTGLDAAHPDLAANVWANAGEIPGNAVDDDGNGYVDDVHGWDFVDADPIPEDRHGHGTHVAGTAAAVGNNATGIAGVAFGARVMALKGIHDSGFGYSSDLAEAILYAAENGADVINNSWGGFGPNNLIFEVVDTANALGTLVVSAAGNDGLMTSSYLWMPGGHPRGLTAGATTTDGSRASFSNYGFELSVLAPGVNVLSARSSQEVFDADLNVGTGYVRLSGTSMATPHVAGAAALVLAADPTLTTAEVRWHVELGAEQPGAPGYEGQRFNPFFGYGRLDAAAAFAQPPVTTRLAPPKVREWHAFTDQVTPVPGASGGVLFTTLDPLPWSVATPPWLIATPASGTASVGIDLSLDTTGVIAGSYAGSLDVAAAGAVDGGAGFSALLHVHADSRIGARIPVSTGGLGGFVGYAPAGGSNGLGALLLFQGSSAVDAVGYGLIDGAGSVVREGGWDQFAYVRDLAVASDGHDFLAAWVNTGPDETEAIRFARIAADGTVLDVVPIEAHVRPNRTCTWYDLAGAGFDGSIYWLGLMESRCAGYATLYSIPVRPDGSVGKLVKVGGVGDYAYAPNFECRSGGCLFAWLDGTPLVTDPVTLKYVRRARALGVVGGKASGSPHQIISDSGWITDLASNGSTFLTLSQQYDYCGPGDLCRTRVLATHIAADGRPLGAGPITVSNVPPAERAFPYPSGVAWTGDGWTASMGVSAVDDSPFFDGGYVLAARLDANGNPLSSEYIGDLVDDAGRADDSVVMATATQSLVAWEDGSNGPLESAPAYPHPYFTEHVARRIAPREPGPAYPDRQIGSIGAQSIDEGERLSFRATAPALAPDATFSATGLPPGAVFDTATRLFQWRPRGDQAGAYGGIVLAASDAVGNVSETITITVNEAVPSITGRVRLDSGGPVGGIAVQARGTADRVRTAPTFTDGTYQLQGGLVPGRLVKVKLSRAARKLYRATPAAAKVTATGGDVQAPDLVVTPR